MPRWVLAGLSVAVAALIAACGSANAPSTGAIPANVRAELLERALTLARENGEPHPYGIKAVRTTLGTARSVLSPPAKPPECEGSTTCNWPAYAVAMRGSFNGAGEPGAPLGAPKRPPYTVMTFVIPAKRPAPYGIAGTVRLGGSYPELKEAGDPVPLG
jgi:hypothetical protein